MEKKKIIVNDYFQKNYEYFLTEKIGENFDERFKPELTPKEMLELGVFGGKYMNDCKNEFPKDWFVNAKLSKKKDPSINYFKIDASTSLKYWQEKGWIYHEDPRGWFQWYCRYYMGRRCLDDQRQIKRWIAMKRHIAQIKNNCFFLELNCRKKQRQALLHWAYDSRKI
ncbi:MAG: hypothetical protein PHT94_03005 [Candidatus Nanoarchaeia archaeon]|nr:hypothetical protein [Candidatus Nanoarchaeia archaeon]